MKRTLMALPSMLAFVLACGDGRTSDQDTGAAGTGAESGALPADTGVPGAGIEDTTAAPSSDLGTPTTDTAADTGSASGAAGAGDKANQNQSGVTDTESGQSELGGDVNQTRPDQGEPVTSKGDTIDTAGTSAP